MHILEISFHTCHFIDISASFTPHSDSEPCFISEPLYNEKKPIPNRGTGFLNH